MIRGAFDTHAPIVFRRNDRACVSAKAEYHREDYIFPRQQSLVTRDLLWEERLPKIPHWGSNRVERGRVREALPEVFVPDWPADPTLSGANPRPEWPFLWLFGLLSLSPPSAETFVILVFPLLLIVALFLVPFVSNRGERAPSRRPVA